MARWALSPLLGNGTSTIDKNNPDTTGPYRPYAAKYATDWAAVIPGKPDGTPAFAWCIVRATAGDLAGADADPTLTMFPDLAYTDVLTAGQRAWLISKCNALGAPSGWVVNGITFGQALRIVGRWLDNKFDVTWTGG